LKFKLTYKLFGSSAVLVEWPATISKDIIQDIISFERKVKEIDSILDTIIAYNSLLIRYQNPINNNLIIYNRVLIHNYRL